MGNARNRMVYLSDEMHRILTDLVNETIRQDGKWGEQNHNLSGWTVIATEELGEFAKAIWDYSDGKDSIQSVRKEAIETAAVMIKIVDYIDRCEKAMAPPYTGLHPKRA